MNFYITVNNRQIEAIKGETVLQTLKRSGISVPTLCNMEGFTPTGACRLCMVEVKGKDDLVPACSYQVEEWMEVHTHTTRVTQARRLIVELLLSGHPDDCLYCERNCHCELQTLAYELNVRERKHSGKRVHKNKDLSSPAIIRDPAKCVLCGRCVRVCEEIIGCSTLEFSGKGNRSGITTTCNRNLNNSTCIACGQCVLVCPTSALYEKKYLAELQKGLNDPNRYAVAVVDPVVSLTLAEVFGYRNMRQAARQLNAVLKRVGFQEVYDFSALHDLYILETAKLLTQGRSETMLSSNCPAWVKFCEQKMHHLVGALSPLKSPSQIAGTLIKKILFPSENGSGDKKAFVAGISPCTARKLEAKRKEYNKLPAPEMDMVMTTRSLEQFIRLHGFDMSQPESEEFNTPFNTASGQGELHGIAGGTMEAVAATTYHILTDGKELDRALLRKIRNTKKVKEISFTIKKRTYRFAAVSGMAEAEQFLLSEPVQQGQYAFIEVMACPGGCVNGGGQPIGDDHQLWRQRQKQLWEMADKNALNTAYSNRSIANAISDAGLNDEQLSTLIRTTYYTRNNL